MRTGSGIAAAPPTRLLWTAVACASATPLWEKARHHQHTRLALAALFLALPLAASADSLAVLNGDAFLRGQLESTDGTSLVWNHHTSGTTLPLPIAEVSRIVFDASEPDSASGDILFLQDEILAGHLDALDQDTASFISRRLGKMSIPRSRIMAARLQSGDNQIVLDAFPPRAKWTTSADGNPAAPRQWRFDEGRISFPGNIAETILTDISLPEASEIRFDLRQDPNRPRDGQLQIDFALDPGVNEGEDFYSLNITSRICFLQRNSPDANRRSNIFGRVQLGELIGGAGVARFRLILDRPNRKVHLFINGRSAGSWTDPQNSAAPPEGTWIRLRGTQRAPADLRNFSVRPWNGVPEGESRVPENFTGERDRIEIFHGGGGSDQVLHGEITGMDPDHQGGRALLISTPHVRQDNAIAVPVDAIRQVYFAKPAADGEPVGDAATPDPRATARTHLRDGTVFKARLLSGDSSALAFASPIAGDITIPTEHILSVYFEHSENDAEANNSENEAADNTPQAAEEE